MQRIFAFDPGTAALGWAVLDRETGKLSILACGVRHYALTRQKIVETMKVRLKPEQRAKARARRRIRLKKLQAALQDTGIMETGGLAPWKRGDGTELAEWLACAKLQALPLEALTRIIFNVHRHRGARYFGPDKVSPKVFLADFLSAQSKWHPQIGPEGMRSKIMSAVFHRRDHSRDEKSLAAVSPLAALASSQLMTVWRALTSEFGVPSRTVIEDALPYRREALEPDPAEPAMQMLRDSGQRVNPRALRKARLFVRQSDDMDTAHCALSGARISFQTAMTTAVEVDHRLPRARGGRGGRSNLQLALASANRAKGAGSEPLEKQNCNPVGIADADALRQSLRMLKDQFATLPSTPRVMFMPPAKISAIRQFLPAPLGQKDRYNLRHHALDAIATGLAVYCGRDGQLPTDLSALIEPALANARLSVQTERSERGRMHDDTRYGLPSAESGFDPRSHVAARRPVESLTPAMTARIADPELRRKALSHGTKGEIDNLQVFGRTRRVKVVHPARGHVRVTDGNGGISTAVLPADNHHMDIVQMRDGRWKAFAVTRHERAQPGWRPDWEAGRTGGKLVMRLHKGDIVELQDEDGGRELLIVARLNGSSGIVHFLRPWAASASERLVAASAGTLKKRQAKAVEANPAGTSSFRRSNAA